MASIRDSRDLGGFTRNLLAFCSPVLVALEESRLAALEALIDAGRAPPSTPAKR